MLEEVFAQGLGPLGEGGLAEDVQTQADKVGGKLGGQLGGDQPEEG
jgi:hypothetical protein